MILPTFVGGLVVGVVIGLCIALPAGFYVAGLGREFGRPRVTRR